MHTKRILIDQNGGLSLERFGRVVKQYCPFQMETTRCGIHCPLFDQPQKLTGPSGDVWNLAICKNIISASECEILYTEESNHESKTI